MEMCTIFCKIKPKNLELITRRLSVIPNQTREALIDEEKHSVTCYSNTGTVKLTLMWFIEPGDPFAKLRGKTLIYFESKLKENSSVRERILTHIRETEAAIGVVADPSFDAIDHLESIIMFIATEHDALIFNGQEMLDSLGEVVS